MFRPRIIRHGRNRAARTISPTSVEFPRTARGHARYQDVARPASSQALLGYRADALARIALLVELGDRRSTSSCFESRHRLFLIDRCGGVGLLSARATGDKIESDDRSSVQVKGAVSDCQPNFALSARSCAPFRLLPQQPSGFSVLKPVARRYTECLSCVAVRTPASVAPTLFSFAFYKQ